VNADPRPVYEAKQTPDLAGFTTATRRRRNLPLGPIAIADSPLPLAARDRTPWRVAILILCLAACRGHSATVEQLHVLSWALRDRRNEAHLLSIWQREPGAPRLLRAVDPFLEDSLRLARAQGLVRQTSTGRVTLSDVGEMLMGYLRNATNTVLEEEQQSLARLGSISETSMWNRLGQISKTAKRGVRRNDS
jgi:hypothetical protein